MRSNHVDGSRQAQTVNNRRRRLRADRIIAALLTPFIANSAFAESQNEALSLSPHMVPASPRQAPARTVPPAKKSLQDLGDASYPRTHYQRAFYLRQKGDLDGALIEFLKATQVNPRLVRAFYEQALIFRERHYLKLAESALQQALAVKPDYQPARILLATIRLEQGNLTGAVSELSRSLGLTQTKPTTPSFISEPEPKSDTTVNPAPPPRPPSLMQTPHTLLPEPEPPPPASPAPASAPTQTPGGDTQQVPDKKLTSTREPFVLEGSPTGPVRPQQRSQDRTAAGAGQRSPSFWQRALPGSRTNKSNAPSTGKFPFAANLPSFDFRFRNPLSFFRRDSQQSPKQQPIQDLQPAPSAQVPVTSRAVPEFPLSAPSRQAPPAKAPEPPPAEREPALPQPPPSPQTVSTQPSETLPSPTIPPKQPPQPASPPKSPPIAARPSAPKPEAAKPAPGWIERVLDGVRDLSNAALQPPAPKPAVSENRPRQEQAQQAPAVDPFSMVVVPGKTRAAGQQREQSIEPIAMVIRQPPALAESLKETTRTSEASPELRPQPVPIARAYSRTPLPAPRVPSERPVQATLPAAPPALPQTSQRGGFEKAPLPDRPVVAELPTTMLSPTQSTRQQLSSTTPALPSAPNRVGQAPAQPSPIQPAPGGATPVPRPPSRSGQQALLPAWLSPAPLSFSSGAAAPTPKEIDPALPQQPAILPNRIEKQRDPFMPVRAVGKPTNPLAFLFGAEPGPRPTPPQRMAPPKLPQPSSPTQPAQVTTPPVVHHIAAPEAPAPPVAGEPPRLVQHPAQPRALPRTTAVETPLPSAPPVVTQEPVKPSTISRVPMSVPRPPSQPLRTEKQLPLPQTAYSPAPLSLTAAQPIPSLTQPAQRRVNETTVNPSRIDAPRTAMESIGAVGRPPVAEPPSASVPPEDPFLAKPIQSTPDPDMALRIAPPAVQRQSAVQRPAPAQQQQPAPTAPPNPSSTASFASATFPGTQSRLLAMADAPRLPAAYLSSPSTAKPEPAEPPPPPAIPLDAVGKRMKYLSEHGTASLKEGEAFMFSEETGEAIIFQANGQTLRRKIAEPKDGQEVVKQRRPDLMFPQELRYNLSLLAKLLPHQEEPKSQPQQQQAPVPTFTLNELMSRPEGMFGWLKQIFHL